MLSKITLAIVCLWILTAECFLPLYTTASTYGTITKSRDSKPKGIVVAQPKLTMPNGGETLLVGDTANISWTGSLPSDTVIIDYSTNGGANWLPVTNSATNNLYKWRVPKTLGNQCVARLTPMPSPIDNWARSAGKTDNDVANSVASDNSGNVVSVGYFVSDSISFGNVHLKNYLASNSDIYVVKYDAAGNVLWAKSAGSSDNDVANSVAIDDNNEVVVTGYFTSNTITFGSTILTRDAATTADIFVVKYDASGNVLWAKSAGGSGADFAQGVAVDRSRNIIITGYSNSPTVTFGTETLTGSGGHDIFITKYDAGGTVLWVKSATGSSNDFANAVSIDNNGNTTVTGYFNSASLTFGGTVLSNAGGSDLFLARYDVNGVLQWAKSAGGNGNEFSYSVASDLNGNTFIAGKFTSASVVFGSYTLFNNGSGSSDFLLVKYDQSGTVQWANSAGGGDSEGTAMNSVATDVNGNVFVAGFFSSDRIDFGSITLNNLTAPLSDIFVAKFNSAGKVLSAESVGGENNDNATGACIDNRGNLLIAGYFNNDTLKLGQTSLLNNGNNDVFVWKTAGAPIEADTSDAVFTIAVPTAQAVDIDMKRGTILADKDSIVVGLITNTGTYPVRIDSIGFTGADATAFSIVSGAPPFSLAVGAQSTLTIRFTPNRAGLHTATLIIFTQSDTLQKTIVGSGATAGAQIASAGLAFPQIICQQTATDTVRIENAGVEDLSISALSVGGANLSDFAVNATAPIAIAPGDIKSYAVTFTPTATGARTAFIRVVSNSVTNGTFDIPLSGSKETATFSIETTTVDLGVLCPREPKNTTIRVKNTGTIDNTIILVNQLPPFNRAKLRAADSTDIVSVFLGKTTPGQFRDTLQITDSICSVTQNVIFTGNIIEPEVDVTDAQIIASTGGAGAGSLKIRNSGGREITIANLPLLPAVFSWGAISLPIIIPAGDSVILPVTYTPTDTAEVRRTITFQATPCSFTFDAVVQGNAAISTIIPEDVQGEVGDTVEIPIRVLRPQVLQLAGITSIQMNLVFNATMLVPIESTPAGQLQGKDRVIHLDLPVQPDTNGIIARLAFRVVLGNDSVTSITINSATPVGGTAQVDVKDGEFRLLGICYTNGEPRLVNTLGTVALTIVKPNPTTDNVEVEVETIERGITEISLYDPAGFEVKKYLSRELPVGKQTLHFDMSGVVSGRYMLVLRTPSVQESAIIEIQR